MKLAFARFRDQLHHQSDALLAPAMRRLAALGISANHVTVAGFLLCVPAALLAATGNDVAAGVVFLLASSLDLFDGALARANGKSTAFGALLDSTLDRVSEALLLGALAWRFALEANAVLAALVVAALTGSFLTSYVRARAEGLGLKCSEGWFTRPERVLLLGGSLLFQVIEAALVLLALLSLLTATQRLVLVRRAIRGEDA